MNTDPPGDALTRAKAEHAEWHRRMAPDLAAFRQLEQKLLATIPAEAHPTMSKHTTKRFGGRHYLRRTPHSIVLHTQALGTSFGITLWRHGAISLQCQGHFLQIVLGDWWQAHPQAAQQATRRRAERRACRQGVGSRSLRV